MFLATLMIAATIALPEAKPATYWVFLVRGTVPPGTAKEQLTEMQNAHIGNFKLQYAAGKLLTAGPLQDPTQSRRGIVVLTVRDRKAVEACCKPDPYVQSGVMKVEASRIETKLGALQTTNIDPDGIVENRLVVFSKMGKASRDATKAHEAYMKTAPGIAFYATVKDKGELAAVALFEGTNDAAINGWLANDPLVKGETWKATVYPQWLSKGILVPVK